MTIKPFIAFTATIVIIVVGLEIIQTWAVSTTPTIVKLNLVQSLEFGFSFFFGIILGFVATEMFYLSHKTYRIKTPIFLFNKSVIQSILITLFVFIICEIIFPIYVLNVSVTALLEESPIYNYVLWYFILYFIIFLLSLIFNVFFELRRKFGIKTLKNFLTSKYYEPIKEEYVYMFLDLASSTEICEQLGDIRYMQLMQDIFIDVTKPILDSKGDIYQYVGDEIVVEWMPKPKISLMNYINCFFKINEAFREKDAYYQEKYNISPKFFGAIHIGPVITAELGQIKIFIEHRGKTLNVSKRLLEYGKKHDFELVISEVIKDRLENISYEINFQKQTSIELKGVQNRMNLYVFKKDT